MKRAVSKSDSASKLKTSKSHLTTALTSHHRTQANSLTAQHPAAHTTHITHAHTVKARQLFAIIETFYSTLCDLPLEKLISSAEPEGWIDEQEETLRSLEVRLGKASRQKEHDYYKCRLRSIETILGNIRENMAMLKRMADLRNYASGTESSSKSNRGSSFDHSARGIRLGQLASETASIKEMREMLNYDEYPIESSQSPNSAPSPCPELMAQTVNSEVEDSEEEEDTMTKSEVICKKKGKQRIIPKAGENYNTSNKGSSSIGGKEAYNDLKDKTLAKVQQAKSQVSLNAVTQDRNKGLQISNEWTKRSQVVNEGSSSWRPQPMPAEYLELIKELRVELLEKDREIEKFLINEREFEETVEIYQARQKEKSTEILFLKENAAIHERERDKMHQEIRRLTSEADELRETVRVERDRHKKEEIDKARLQERLLAEAEEKRAMKEQMEQLQQQLEAMARGEGKTKDTLDVYARKYLELHEQLEGVREEKRVLGEQAERLRSAPQELCESVKRIVERHKAKIFQPTA